MGRRGLHRPSGQSFEEMPQRLHDVWNNHEVLDPIQKGVGETCPPELRSLAGNPARLFLEEIERGAVERSWDSFQGILETQNEQKFQNERSLPKRARIGASRNLCLFEVLGILIRNNYMHFIHVIASLYDSLSLGLL